LSISAVDVVRVAFDHTATQLFRPFRLGQWTRLAVVAFLAGELTPNGCRSSFPSRRGGTSPAFLAQALPFNPLTLLGIGLLVLVFFVLAIAFLYVSSRMRFVLFDSIVGNRCHIRAYWRNRHSQALQYFFFQLFMGVIIFSGILTLIGTALFFGFGFGWFRNPRDHLLPLILGGLLLAAVFAVFVILALVISVLAKDFVVPQMALEDTGVVEGWSRLLRMMQEDKAAYAGYIGMKIVLSIGGSIALFVVILAVVLVLLIPFGGVGLAGFLIARVLGLTWNLFTLTVTILFGAVAVSAMIYAIALASVPLAVFFPAYSIYFFADRYEPLRLRVSAV
jgi:hypothetical protein